MALSDELNHLPQLVATTTTPASLTLDPDREYTVHHLGRDASGNATTDAISLAFTDTNTTSGTGDGDYSVGTNKLVLQPGDVFVIGPGIRSVSYDAHANDPSFHIIPGRRFYGQH